MRVIAGAAKGRKLQTREGNDTRPTTDRLKETLFAVIQFEIPECRFLDLFSGSGGIGIEALSRGATEAVFVEANRDAFTCIRNNVRTTGFTERSRLMQQDVFSAIRALGMEQRQFDVIFLDPPYNHGLEEKTLQAIEDYGLLAPEGLIVVESSAETPIDPGNASFEIEKVKEYKVTKFTLLRSTVEAGETGD